MNCTERDDDVSKNKNNVKPAREASEPFEHPVGDNYTAF